MAKVDPRLLSHAIALYDEYTHAPLPRRVFLERLARLAGGGAAALALLPLLENDARAALVAPDDTRLSASWVTYPGASGEMRGYLAVPAARARAAGKGKAPPVSARGRAGVIVVHENRGLNPHIQDVARRVALAGYTALAPDLLSPLGGTPADEDAARAGIGKLDGAQVVADLGAAARFLRARADASGAVGAVGFCWGGGVVLRLAAAGAGVEATVSFYGMLPPAEEVVRLRGELLLHFAGKDERINAGLPAFEKAAADAGLCYTSHLYEGVEHAFHNDTSAARYDQAAAELAWSRTLAFFARRLGAG